MEIPRNQLDFSLSIIIQGWWDSDKKVSIAKQSDGAMHNNGVSP